MDDFEFDRIIQFIKDSSGIIPRDSHKSGIKNFLEKRIEELGINSSAYYNLLLSDILERELLINSTTVNETYFFREELQFALLKERIFPEIMRTGVSPVKIWSAASSSGEEIYSLHLLASSLGIKTECIASDINSAVLKQCESGRYTKKSLKSVDGALFQNLLAPYKKENGSIEFTDRVKEKISCRRINLSKLKDFPSGQHIIFLRNVFIYFDLEMRHKILQKISDECLCDGGYIFVSMNEVASVDFSILPKNLEKISDGKVFYFRKKSGV